MSYENVLIIIDKRSELVTNQSTGTKVGTNLTLNFIDILLTNL